MTRLRIVKDGIATVVHRLSFPGATVTYDEDGEWPTDATITLTGGEGAALGTATPLVESGSGTAGTAAAGSHEDHAHPAAGAVNLYVGAVSPYDATLSGTSGFTANRGYWSAFQVQAAVTVSVVYFVVGTQSGNIDFGIYAADGTKLATTGSFACPAAGGQSQALSASVALVPGTKYFAAVAADNGTCRIYVGVPGISNALLAGGAGGLGLQYNIDAKFPLPTSFSTADTTAAGGRTVYCFFG